MKMRVFGDWHSNTNFAVKQLTDSGQVENIERYIHVGDFGVWPSTVHNPSYKTFLPSIERLLESQDRELWFIDGNHEYFPIIKELKQDERGLGILSPHVFYIPRGYAWEEDGKRLMGLGGAVSVDRSYRKIGQDYFKEEEITLSDVARAKEAGSVDILFTHDAPLLPVPKVSFSSEIDRDAENSMAKIAEITAYLEPKILVHGHYHIAHERNWLNTLVIGLDCDRGAQERNFIDLDTVEI